jgi:hypothetical protein
MRTRAPRLHLEHRAGGQLRRLHGRGREVPVARERGEPAGTWKAWVSDTTSSPSARFAQVTVSYRLLDGTLVASSWTALTSGTLANSIRLNENTQPFQNGSEVWTATGVDGTLLVHACTSFTDASNGNASWAAEGLADQTGSKWTNAYTQFCDRTAHIYCFEQ